MLALVTKYPEGRLNPSIQNGNAALFGTKFAEGSSAHPAIKLTSNAVRILYRQKTYRLRGTQAAKAMLGGSNVQSLRIGGAEIDVLESVS